MNKKEEEISKIVIGLIGFGGMARTFLKWFQEDFKFRIFSENIRSIEEISKNYENMNYVKKYNLTNENICISLEDLVHSCDFLLLCTPIQKTGSLIKEIIPFAKKSTILIDINGIKTPILDQLRYASEKMQVLSLHPLYGPTVETLVDKRVIVMPITPKVMLDQRIILFLNIYRKNGSILHEIPIEKHDEEVTLTLNLGHLLNFGFMNVLKESGKSIKQILNIATTTFLSQLTLSEAVTMENPEFYAEMQILNPNILDLLDSLIESFILLKKAIQNKKNPKNLEEILVENQKYALLDPLSGNSRFIINKILNLRSQIEE